VPVGWGGRISEIQFFRKRTLGKLRWAAKNDPKETLFENTLTQIGDVI
jgi:hypothetical protein